MKAVVYEQYGEPNVLKIAEIEKPAIGPNEVLVNVKASGINPVDTYFRKGIRQVDKFPFVPHHDLAGAIVEVGENVTHVKPGDHVWATNAKGASAEYVAISGDLVFPLQSDLAFTDGAALAMPFMTAHLSLFFRGKLDANESVLIYGASGAVGNAAVQLAKRAGAHVIATASNEEKANIAKQAGANDVINYKEEDLVSRVMEITDGKGVNLIIDMSLSENIEKDLDMIAIGGRIVTVGSPVNNTPTLPWRQLNLKLASLIGFLQFSAPIEEISKAGKKISEGFSEGSYKAHVGKVLSYQEAAAAHELLEQKTVSGRIILNHED
ncbi:NADPH:quinone reductase [bacterium LRH843]|nr:NADPH:quinone reductase [bacterium LRH843]